MSLEDVECEAAFQAELARMRLEGPSLDQESKAEVNVICHETDDDNEDEYEPPSLQLLRKALEGRERAAEAFGRDWQRFCSDFASDDPSRPMPGHRPVSDTFPSDLLPTEDSLSCNATSATGLNAASGIQGESQRIHHCQELQWEKANHHTHRRAGDASADAEVGMAEKLLGERTHDEQLLTYTQKLRWSLRSKAGWLQKRKRQCASLTWQGSKLRCERRFKEQRLQRCERRHWTCPHYIFPMNSRLGAWGVAGLVDAARIRLAEVEAAATGAAAKLRTAASSGSHLEFQAALAAAKAFPKLSQLVAESSTLFEERRANADAAICRRTACSQVLMDAASSGSLHKFLAARGAGTYAGMDMKEILAADRTIVSRQLASLSCLVRTLDNICVGALPPLKFDASMAMVAWLGDAQALLKRACDAAASTFYLKTVASEVAGPSTGNDLGKNLKALLSPGRQLALSDVRSMSGAVALDWPLLVSMVHLGLPDVVCLALCVLEVHHSVLLAEGSSGLIAIAPNDYWGVALLSAADVQGMTAALGPPSTMGHVGGRNHEIDEISKRAVWLLSRRKGVICARRWGTPADSLESKDIVRCERFLSNSFMGRKSLTEVISLKHGSGETSGCPATAACLLHLLHLDLCLERLTSLQGLDLICPMLRSLSADANQMSSLEGLQGLTGLEELSLKQNHLASLLQLSHAGQAMGPALPSGSCLKWLMLDSNELSGQLKGLKGCSGLRSLSLADNFLTDMGTELEPCKSMLTSLSLRNNRLTSAKGQLASLTNLRNLDVSGNRLTSLEGLQELLLLQSLCASGNAVAAMPKHFCLPHLTALDLGQNALTSFGICENSSAGYCLNLPSLKCLVLRENSISRLGSLRPMLHLTLLDLSFNKLASAEAFRVLAHLSGLRKLNITNNPATDVQDVGAERSPQWRHMGATSMNSSRQSLPSMTANSASIMAWSLPLLQELDYGSVAAHHRLDSAVRAAVVSPTCAMVGVRQMRTMGCEYLVLRRSSFGKSTAPIGCQLYAASSQGRAPAVNLCPGRTGVVFTGASELPIDSAALQRVLVAAVDASLGATALCGLHAEIVCYDRTSFGHSPSDKFMVHQDPDAQDSIVMYGCARFIKLKSDRIAWLTHLGQRWQASLPLEVLYLHGRQLSCMPFLGPRCCTTTTPGADIVPPLRSSHFTDAALAKSISSVVAMHQGADILDTAASRCWRPSFRFSIVASRIHAGSAATVGIRSAGVANKASVLAICAEAYWRSDASGSQTGRQLVEDLLRILRHDDHGSVGCSRPASGSNYLIARPSYFTSRLRQHAKAAVTVIQASLRGLQTRKSIPLFHMERQKLKAVQMAAATVVQACWRGHYVRRLLPALQEEEEKWRQELHRRESATVIIQAHFRGYLVRKRLSTALAVVKLSPGLGKDFDQLSDSSELEEMLQGFASPLEDLSMDEGISCNWRSTIPSLASAAPCSSLPGNACEPHARKPWDSNSREMGGCSTAACAELQALLLTALPNSSCEAPHETLPGVQEAYSIIPPSKSMSSTSRVIQVYPAAAAVQCSDHGQRIEVINKQRGCLNQPLSAHPVIPAGFFPSSLLPSCPSQSAAPQRNTAPSPLGMPHCESSMANVLRHSLHEDALPPGCSTEKGDLASEYMCSEQKALFSDGIRANNRGEYQRRHLERLRKFMAEWGFKDLCTAETYYRRVLRQKQGHTRHQFQEKQQVPSQRPLIMVRSEAKRMESRIIPSTDLQLIRATDGGEDLPGLTSSPRCGVHSVEDVILSNYGYTNDLLSQNNRGMSSADAILPISSSRRVLAPLDAASSCKLPCKLGTAQRPHHLPTLTNNNWIVLPSSQSLTQNISVGKSTMFTGRQAVANGNHLTVAGKLARDCLSTGVGLPETTQSVDSSPELIVL
uniref:MTM0638 n=1 Tax=Volvox carteri f. nagariensis TaxID=3068 RepID=D9CJ73_VOLCA|nr:MTM0638 [Volvox carteri f. nagariensis]